MRIAYLFFAYKNPCLIKREIQVLDSANAGFFVHIDKKIPMHQFSGISGPKVNFIEERIEVHWAEFSGVRAVLSLIQRALAEIPGYDYLVLLSGSEFPLQNSAYIESFLQERMGTEYMDLVSIPNAAAGKALSHVELYRPPSSQPVRRTIAKVMTRFGVNRRDFRRHFGSLTPYGGHTWWALTRDAAEYVMHFVREHPRLVKYFETAPQPEETFFHTILGNSKFRNRIRCSLVYEDWSAGGTHPAMINAGHVSHFENVCKIERNDIFGSGEVLFARKLSDDTVELANRIDSMIAKKGA